MVRRGDKWVCRECGHTSPFLCIECGTAEATRYIGSDDQKVYCNGCFQKIAKCERCNKPRGEAGGLVGTDVGWLCAECAQERSKEWSRDWKARKEKERQKKLMEMHHAR